MKKILCIIVLLLFCGCDSNPKNGCDNRTMPSIGNFRGYMLSCDDCIVTDDGIKTTCVKSKIDGKEYFVCKTHLGYVSISPVVK